MFVARKALGGSYTLYLHGPAAIIHVHPQESWMDRHLGPIGVGSKGRLRDPGWAPAGNSVPWYHRWATLNLPGHAAASQRDGR